LLGPSLAPPVVALLEHLLALGVQRPVVALARLALLPRHLDKAVVE